MTSFELAVLCPENVMDYVSRCFRIISRGRAQRCCRLRRNKAVMPLGLQYPKAGPSRKMYIYIYMSARVGSYYLHTWSLKLPNADVLGQGCNPPNPRELLLPKMS